MRLWRQDAMDGPQVKVAALTVEKLTVSINALRLEQDNAWTSDRAVKTRTAREAFTIILDPIAHGSFAFGVKSKKCKKLHVPIFSSDVKCM